MRDVIENIFGVYTPVLTDVYDASGAYVGQAVASGFAGVDWEYIAGVLLFSLCLIAFFKILKGVLMHD